MTNDEMKTALEKEGYTVLDPVKTRDLKTVQEVCNVKSYDGMNNYYVKTLLARIFPDIQFRF